MINIRRWFALTLVLGSVAIPFVLSRSSSSSPTPAPTVPAKQEARQDALGTPVPAAATGDASLRALEIGEVWQDDGLELQLVKSELFPDSAIAYFALTDLGPVDRKIHYRVDNFAAIDNLGRPVLAGGLSWQPDPVLQADCLSRTVVFKPHVRQGLVFTCHYGNYEGLMLKLDQSEAALTHVTITVSGIDTMGPSRWRIPVGRIY